MKRISTIILSVAAVSTMLFVGCKKDVRVVTLGVQVENAASNSKMYIDENHNPVFFDSGDSINVNGTWYNVEKIGTTYQVNVDTNEAGNYYACYPAKITNGFNGKTNQSIHLSRWQVYKQEDGVQNVQLPSGAVIEGNSGKKLKFYNFCSLLEVSWKNTSSDAYDIVGMEVTVPGTALYGDGTVTIDGTNTALQMTATGEKYNRVNLDITEDDRETVAAGDSTRRKYYISLPPFNGKKVSVRIFVMKHSQTTLDDQKIRTVTISTSNAVNMPRNYIVPVRLQGGPKEDNGLTGYFSVRGDEQGNDTYKVVFSRGNLQHIGSTSHSSGTWKFADRQYDFFGRKNVSSNAYFITNTMDLFCWSETITNDFGMHTYDYWSDGDPYVAGVTFQDWGAHKTISGDAPNTWFTLTSDEWYYLFHTRVHLTGDDLRGKARITGIQGHEAVAAYGDEPYTQIDGFILLPDDWTSEDIPSGLSFTPSSNNDTALHNVYTVSEWARMEAAGAMFLPAAGWGSNYHNRSGYHGDGSDIWDTYKAGQYWSSTMANTGYAEAHSTCFQYNYYYWHLQTSSGNIGNHTDANYDMEWWRMRSVRLVKPAPGYTDPDGRSTVNQ